MEQKRIIGLSIDLKKSKSMEGVFSDQMLHAVMSALSVIYSEAFIWSMKNNLMVWVVGTDSELLVKIFLRNHILYNDIRLYSGIKAEDLFEDCVEGRALKEENMDVRMDSLYRGFEQAMDMNCLGPMLFPLVNNAKSLFTNNMRIVGVQNAASTGQKDEWSSKITKLTTPGFLYRFSIN
jgi:hypothetical protein